MPERDVTVPQQARQGQLVDEIGNRVASVVEGRWSTLIFNHRNLCEFFTGRIQVYRPGGLREHVRPPDSVVPLTDELRRVMYRPGRGTWFSAHWSITRDGGDAGLSARVVFNYDDEPVWRWPAHPGLYALDLETFPRDEEYVPGWLRQKVNGARRSL